MKKSLTHHHMDPLPRFLLLELTSPARAVRVVVTAKRTTITEDTVTFIIILPPT